MVGLTRGLQGERKHVWPMRGPVAQIDAVASVGMGSRAFDYRVTMGGREIEVFAKATL